MLTTRVLLFGCVLIGRYALYISDGKSGVGDRLLMVAQKRKSKTSNYTSSLDRLDLNNRQSLEHYIANIHIMEELTRIQINLDLLKKNQALNQASGEKTIAVEVLGLKIGSFVLIAFPGELPVQIGLAIKERSPHPFTFVSGVSNGYLYYTPTREQLANLGHAQEDSDCLLAPEWQALFEDKVATILRRL